MGDGRSRCPRYDDTQDASAETFIAAFQSPRDLWLMSYLQTANNKVDKQSDYMTIRDQCIAIFIQLLHLWSDEVVETASFVVSIVRGLSIYRLALTNEHDAERITSTAHHLKL